MSTDSDEVTEVGDFLDAHLDLLEDASDFDVDLLRTDTANDTTC